ncbi:MAG: dipeptidase [Acidimicrobiia bacterium]|nr:dipeptidase [Acidimicrobiia bacterium]
MHDDLSQAIDDLFPSVRADYERLIRIPSVSAPEYDPTGVRASAELTMELLEEAGVGGVRTLHVEGCDHPAVYGEISAPDGAPTVTLYAHHDVQPTGPLDEWDSEPFEPSERDGRIYGRGTSDDKSGIAIHLAAIRAHGGSPPVGIKLFIEGEEESGSEHLDDYMRVHGELLACDAIVIADSGNWRTGQPGLATSLRGLVDLIVEVKTLRYAVHSGEFGGALPDALTSMSRMLASLHNPNGEVAVVGLVSGEADPLDLTEEELRAQSGALEGVELIGEGSLTSRMWTKPSISVLAIDAPPVAEAINQLVASARAKISLRLAPGDDPQRAVEALTAHLEANVPWGAQLKVTPGSLGQPYSLETTGPYFDAFRTGFETAWGKEAVNMGVGGSIPFVAAFEAIHPNATALLTGAADDKSRAHGPNESVDITDLRNSMLAEAVALRLMAG